MTMIRDILSSNFKQISFPEFQKFTDGKYEIMFENNRNIIVLDKMNNKMYLDLRYAHSTLTNLKKLP